MLTFKRFGRTLSTESDNQASEEPWTDQSDQIATPSAHDSSRCARRRGYRSGSLRLVPVWLSKGLAFWRRDCVEAVLCWDQDRFGRFDPLEAGYWIKPLRDAGIRLETVAQGRIDWEDFAGRIIFRRPAGRQARLPSGPFPQRDPRTDSCSTGGQARGRTAAVWA